MDAQRGGGIAVGFAVVFFIAKSNIAEEVYTALQQISQRSVSAQNTDAAAEFRRLTLKVSDLESWLLGESRDQKVLNRYMALATAVGTLAAAFGDLVSKGLLKFYSFK
ncbi:MAG: hypothetical protein ABSH01_06990 [Terriglobia bacterium]